MKARGDQIIRFIESNLRLPEGPWAGQPFTVLPAFRPIIRAIYDERLPDDSRRIQEAYIEAGKGSCKTPTVAAVGIAECLFNGPGGLAMSLAATYRQAWETSFDAARKIITASPTLRALKIEVQEKQIRFPGGTRWVCMPSKAGKGGFAGYRPTLAVIEEAQELNDRAALDAVTANQAKMSRRNPLRIVVGNAGRPESVAHQLHLRAKRYMAGERTPDLARFAGWVWGLDAGDDWKDERLWERANPTLGVAITMESLLEEFAKALKDPASEHRFRQLHLGQWLGTSQTGYLDMEAWGRCQRPLPPDDVLATYPAWIGLDLSIVGDLSAVSIVWVDPESRRMFVRVRQWVTSTTAEREAEDDGTDYDSMAGDCLTVTDTAAIDHHVRADIAQYVENLCRRYDVRHVCYDAYRASEIVQRLERSEPVTSKGIICEPIKPTVEGIGGATAELSARINAGTIDLHPDPLLTSQARNLHILSTSFGVRPCKPKAQGRYAGTRHAHIDGVVATILAMSRAMRFAGRIVDEAEPVLSRLIAG